MGSHYFALRRAGSCKLAFQHRAAHACHADIGELAHRRAACKIHSHIVVQTGGKSSLLPARAFHQGAAELTARHPAVCAGVEGDAHMTALRFLSVEDAAAFCAAMNRRCVDISAQTYKPNCPPVALTKLPLIATETMVSRLLALFDEELTALEGAKEATV